jgi:hypothetical protein
LSSWYVWAAIGLFPLTPGSANLALASPLFPSVTITLQDGHRLVEHAPGAAASRPYIQGLRVTGVARPASVPASETCAANESTSSSPAGGWDRPWLPASVLQSGGTLNVTLAASPSSWGTAPEDAFPSSGSVALPAVGSINPSGAITLTPGVPATAHLGLDPAGPTTTAVDWDVTPPPDGLQVTPTTGTLTPGRACASTRTSTQALTLTGSIVGPVALHITLHTKNGVSLPPVVLQVNVGTS